MKHFIITRMWETPRHLFRKTQIKPYSKRPIPILSKSIDYILLCLKNSPAAKNMEDMVIVTKSVPTKKMSVIIVAIQDIYVNPATSKFSVLSTTMLWPLMTLPHLLLRLPPRSWCLAISALLWAFVLRRLNLSWRRWGY